MAKQRGRKTTNSLFTGVVNGAVTSVEAESRKSIQSSFSNLRQRLTVTPGGGAPSGSFTVKLAESDTAQAIPHNATSAVVTTALLALESVTDGTGATCTGGPLGSSPVQIEFTSLTAAAFDPACPKAPLLKLTPALVNAAVRVVRLNNVSPTTWTWLPDTFKDANSGRVVMEVASMALVLNQRGKWLLTYVPRVYTRRHKWIYKLQAFDIDDKQLFSLIMRPIHRATDSFTDIAQMAAGTQVICRQVGSENAASVHFDDISYWTRRGVGEFHD